jgi:hypothetical protein
MFAQVDCTWDKKQVFKLNALWEAFWMNVVCWWLMSSILAFTISFSVFGLLARATVHCTSLSLNWFWAPSPTLSHEKKKKKQKDFLSISFLLTWQKNLYGVWPGSVTDVLGVVWLLYMLFIQLFYLKWDRFIFKIFLEGDPIMSYSS